MTTRPTTAAGSRWGRATRAAGAVGLAVALAACGSTVRQTASAPSVDTGLGPATGPSTALPDGGLVDGLSGGLGASPGAAAGASSSGDVPGAGGAARPGPGGQAGPAGAPAGGAPIAVAPGQGGAGGGPAQGGAPAAPADGGTGPVQIGFVAAKDVGEAMSSLGYEGVSTGSGQRQAEAVTALLNAQGGIAGRPVEAVVFELDVASSEPLATQFQAACAHFFEDNAVRAVVSLQLDEVLAGCVADRGAPLVHTFTSAPPEPLLARFPLLAVNSMEQAASVRALVRQLAAQGWFEPEGPTEVVRVGLITHDHPGFAGVPDLVAAELGAAGLSLTSTAFMPYPSGSADIAAASSAGSSVSLRFRADGVTRVLAVDQNGFGVSWFALGAASQGYFPTLGVSTAQQPSSMPAVLSPESLDGAAGIGWNTTMDNRVADQAATSARTDLCVQALGDAGEDMSSSTVRLAGISICDATFLLADTWRAGDLSAGGFTTGLAALGTGFQSAVTFGSDFARSRAGVTTYRPLAYDAGCSCFAYTGPPTVAG